MIRRTVREWQRIGYGDDDATIPETQADRLAAAARQSGFAGKSGTGVLDHGRKSLRAKGVVGVISAPGCQLEILPKIESGGESEVADSVLRERLIHMLAVVYDLPVESGPVAKLGWQRDTVLEILIRLFGRKLMDAVRRGMPRQYLEHQDELPAMRGRLDITRQFSRLAASPQILACTFDDLSPDHALNQVMKAVVTKLSRLSQSPDTAKILRELSFIYSDVTAVSAAALRWDRIVIDRTNERWRDLLSFARLFLTDRYQQTQSGLVDGHALLFEMNMLFEAYIARLLKRALAGTGYRVASQGGLRNCLYEGEKGRFQTRPDILVSQGRQIRLVIDTKWKRLFPQSQDPKLGISQSDVYQLMAYSQLYEAEQVMLLYPHHGGLQAGPEVRSYTIGSANADERLNVATHDLTTPRENQRACIARMMLGILDVGEDKVTLPPEMMSTAGVP
ncbi:McrC family protein [Hyphobacterium indicum]|uniref:McrC family protein n=1 Tax=Hyphobacterium indicum TaxID=2162714 RepID=UPI000D6562F3|nr:restriction endonuclease [Hyphobacterium indicum]